MADRVMDRLWLRLTEIYGARWTSQYGAEPLETWTKGLADLTPEQIGLGVARIIRERMKFVPNLPDFRGYCLPSLEELGLPSVEQGFREVCRNAHPSMYGHEQWSHPAVHHAATEAGLANFRTLSMDPARQLFARNYAIACDMVAKGEPLREIPKALPAEVMRKGDQGKARDALAAMRAAVTGMPA